jgi:hypothetical protein
MDCIPLIQLFLAVFDQFRHFGEILGEKGEIRRRFQGNAKPQKEERRQTAGLSAFPGLK